jgi:signal transduction histidine kinase
VRLEVRFDATSAAVRVRAEIGLVERLLASLVENALRHTPAGGSVGIETVPVEGAPKCGWSTPGEGIAAAALAGIFDRYDRAERVGGASRGSGHGGLGLAIARRIVELHGGRLRIESAPGRGTRSRSTCRSPRRAPARRAVRRRRGSPPSARRKSAARILIADRKTPPCSCNR